MRFIPACHIVLTLLVLCPWWTAAQTEPPDARQKRIAVTIDDLPLNGPEIGLQRTRTVTEKLVASIAKNRVPVVGFVNESRLYVPGETDDRIAILKAWTDANIELGNHTFSHLGFKDATLAQYEDDFLRGDTVTRMLMKRAGRPERFYRHPFLQMGVTRELEQTFEDFIAARGYRIAPVTIDSLDWLILSAYLKAQKDQDRQLMQQVSDEYLRYVDQKFAYCETASDDLFGRPVAHILLLHANELNADNFDQLLEVIKKRGYRFVTLEQALADPIYRFPDRYTPTSDWLSAWAASKSKKYEPPMPAKSIMNIYRQSQGQ